MPLAGAPYVEMPARPWPYLDFEKYKAAAAAARRHYRGLTWLGRARRADGAPASGFAFTWFIVDCCSKLEFSTNWYCLINWDLISKINSETITTIFWSWWCLSIQSYFIFQSTRRFLYHTRNSSGWRSARKYNLISWSPNNSWTFVYISLTIHNTQHMSQLHLQKKIWKGLFSWNILSLCICTIVDVFLSYIVTYYVSDQE